MIVDEFSPVLVGNFQGAIAFFNESFYNVHVSGRSVNMGFWTFGTITVYVIGFIAGIFLSIVLHELGHLACGRLSGYRFVSFRLMNPAFLAFVAAKNGFLDGDEKKAFEIVAQARKLVSSLQNLGQEHSITLMLDRLESRLKACCGGSRVC